VDNASNVFYGIVYGMLFAIPLVGAPLVRSGTGIWLRIASFCGLLVSLSAIFFTIYPIIDVPSPLIFGAKIVLVTAIANAIGVTIFVVGEKARRSDKAHG
jgi:hypothetical protein